MFVGDFFVIVTMLAEIHLTNPISHNGSVIGSN